MMNTSFLPQLTCCFAAILAIESRQADADASLVNLEPQATLSIFLRKPEQLWVFFCELSHTLL